MRHKSILAVGVLLCILVVGVPLVANSVPAGPTDTPSMRDATSDILVAYDVLGEHKILPASESEVDALQREARALPGDRFAGFSRDDERQLIVHLTDVEGEPRPETIGGRQVQYETYSYDELKQAQTKLDREHSSLREAAGVTLAGWGVDSATNSLRIEVVTADGQTDAAARAIQQLIPTVPISVIPVTSLPRG